MTAALVVPRTSAVSDAENARTSRRSQVVRGGPAGRHDAGGDEPGELAQDLAEDRWSGPNQRAQVEPDDVDRVPVDQVPGRQRRLTTRRARDHDAAGHPLRRGQARGEHRTARRLEHQVDAGARGQVPDLGGEVGAARVQDVVGAQVPHDAVLLRRGGPEDDRSTVLRRDDRRLPCRARRGVDQHRLPRREAAERTEGGQRGRPVHDQTQCLLLGPALGQGHRRRRGQDHELGERPVADTDDAAPRRRTGDALAPRDDDPGGLEAGGVHGTGAVPERATGLRDVREVHPRRDDADEDLARTRDRRRRVGDQVHVLRSVEGGLLQRAHGHGPFVAGERRRACLPPGWTRDGTGRNRCLRAR
ncbi:hypothetical protein Acsp06_15040 [Actinomycetospora sp. NBRC 106375]|nr:hypothetical protein Acsp06_15040 [Actinomycetospora sp. NBRC 106375]